MAYPVEVTISTGNKVSLNYQSQEVNVSITYHLEREDADLLVVVEDKARELARAHALAWKRVKDGDAPAPVEEEEAKAAEAPLPEEPQVLKEGATMAQGQLIHSLALQAGQSEEKLGKSLQTSFGCHAVEELGRDQAAYLLVELGREERERFERERARVANQPDRGSSLRARTSLPSSNG